MKVLNPDNHDMVQDESTKVIDEIIEFDKTDSDFNIYKGDTADDYCE